MPLIHTFTHQWRLAAMHGTNQLVRSNWGVLLKDTSTRSGWDRPSNPPTARRQLLPPEPYRPNRMELLAMPHVPLWSFSGGRISRFFRDGQHSLQIWILLSISREEWRRKLGGPSRRTWRSFGMPARWPSMPSPTTSSTSSTTLCQTGWQLFCRPKEPIQDINYLTFSPWWNTRLIFHLSFYLLFEKDKMYWL